MGGHEWKQWTWSPVFVAFVVWSSCCLITTLQSFKSSWTFLVHLQRYSLWPNSVHDNLEQLINVHSPLFASQPHVAAVTDLWSPFWSSGPSLGHPAQDRPVRRCCPASGRTLGISLGFGGLEEGRVGQLREPSASTATKKGNTKK